MTAISSYTELIANPTAIGTSVEFIGTLKFTPVADQHGDTEIGDAEGRGSLKECSHFRDFQFQEDLFLNGGNHSSGFRLVLQLE